MREHGVMQITLNIWSFNHDAQRFFQSIGFEPFNVIMRKDLERADPEREGGLNLFQVVQHDISTVTSRRSHDICALC